MKLRSREWRLASIYRQRRAVVGDGMMRFAARSKENNEKERERPAQPDRSRAILATAQRYLITPLMSVAEAAPPSGLMPNTSPIVRRTL